MTYRSTQNQPIFDKLIKKIVEKGNTAQAYIIIGKKETEMLDKALYLAKSIICPDRFTLGCQKCNICKRIDDNAFGELCIICPENNVIKKEEILKIRDKFQTYSLEGKNQIYIINLAETLQSAAANSILKFLEEPDSNTVAILTSLNPSKILPTIMSRCQVINLSPAINNEDLIIGFSGFNNKEEAKKMLDIGLLIDSNGYQSLIDNSKDIIKISEEKAIIQSLLKVLLLFYRDCINFYLNGNLEYFDMTDNVSDFINKNSKEKVSSKISFILKKIEELDYNVNINLFISDFTIGIGEINND